MAPQPKARAPNIEPVSCVIGAGLCLGWLAVFANRRLSVCAALVGRPCCVISPGFLLTDS